MNVPELMNAFARGDTVFVKGEGARLWDKEGNEYLDALAGIAVCGLGHAHPGITQAICDQAHTLTHCSNLFYNEPQQSLAKKLCDLSGMDNVFFSNSGAEANEAALKIARKYGHQKNIDVPTVIVMDNSFHGRTMATLSATGNAKVREWFQPWVEGFIHVPFNDLQAVIDAGKNNPNVVAVFVEPIQGEGGINIPAENYLSELRKLCDSNDWLLMLDEIQSGMGRTGKFFAYQHSDFFPDVVTVAKGLGNGFPIGACLAKGKASRVIEPGNHGTTFGGNPLACHTAETVLDIIANENLMERATVLGDKLIKGFRKRLANNTIVADIRGHGLLVGIELSKNCAELAQRGLTQGIVINITAGKVVRLLPPLIISDEQADIIVEKVSSLIDDFQ
ncbi:aspartate aminotransferase family protein [Aurantivibrio infirmus]